jgi:hypothetical protein
MDHIWEQLLILLRDKTNNDRASMSDVETTKATKINENYFYLGDFA